MNNKAKLEIQKFGWEHVLNYRVNSNKSKRIRFSSHRALSKITKIYRAPDNIFKILSVWFFIGFLFFPEILSIFLSNYVPGFIEKKINPIKNYMKWLVDIPKGFIKDDQK